MEWYLYPLIIMAGFLAGVINTLAGSGSIVILLLLPFLGLTPAEANGTNRVGVMTQTLVSSVTFMRRKMTIPYSFRWQLFPAIAGGIAGAFISVEIPENIRSWMEAGLMVPILVMILRDPKGWMDAGSKGADRSRSLVSVVIFFLIGMYGGFLQAGVGIYLLVGFVMYTSYGAIQSNFLKVLITGAFTLPALLIFMANGQVNWTYGLLISIGQSAGAYAATLFAVSRPDAGAWIRRLLVVMVVISIFRFSGLDLMILGLFR